MCVDSFSLLIKDHIAPILKNEGFRKNNLKWNRGYNDFVQVINIQKAKYNTSSSISFTINLGIFSPSVFEIIWETRKQQFVNEIDCLLRTRIGPVIQNNFTGTATDKWWQIDNNTNIEEVSQEIVSVLERTAFPFLDDFDNLAKIVKFIDNQSDVRNRDPLQQLNLACIYYILGEEYEFSEILSNTYKLHESWRDRCKIIATNTGLDLI